MKNLDQNMTCAEVKLSMIEDILKMPLQEIEKQFLSKDWFNYELNEEQARCMKIKASDIILGNKGEVINDFEITTNSFKAMNINFEYLHFHFIDQVSISQDFGISIDNFGHDLYYMIIICDQDKNLLNFDFNNTEIYDAYIVNGNLDIEKVQSFSIDKYKNVRKKFLSEVGDRIRRNSTHNLITEYITFNKEQVKKFQNEFEADTTFKVRVVSISDSCDINSTSARVSDYLRDFNNQQKLSLAFQKSNSGSDSNFYDIGNMQP